MAVEYEEVKQPIKKPADRVWPLKGSIVVFASIVYVVLMLA